VLLPLPPHTVDRVLDQIGYYHRRHAAARRSHHQRTERWIANMDAVLERDMPLVAPPIRA
jgi:hypothetical protein